MICRRFGDSTAVVVTAGGIAGILSWLVSFPQDVIKSRLQADSFGANQKYRGPLHCLQTSWRNEGPTFLFRGIGSTFIRVFPVTAVSFGTEMKKWGSNQIGDTLQDIKDLKSETVAEENTLSSTVATDGPDIIAVQETLISDEYFARVYPEQMLWACPSSFKHQEDEAAKNLPMQVSVSSFSNHSQFTQNRHRKVEQQNH